MKNLLIKIIALIAYAAMLAVNYFANSLPINNRSTGEISDSYPNLFSPAGLTFSIWGLIYLLLGAYVVYQFLNKDQKIEDLLKKINPLFIATSVANISWIFAWHYDFICLSVLIIAALILALIKIADILRTEKLTPGEKFYIMVPFSVYFGWITVAAIANFTVFLVSIGWNGFGIADYAWTSIILMIGALIGVLRMHKDENIAYGLVLVWAYLGILIKHISASGFNGQNPGIIFTVIACLVLYVFFIWKIFYKKIN
ncbi:MAG: tryptophan-rich sensory protein [Saprospiraceae bacterium]|nr:tryptophan-rich sensory protein [Saprospiraceae bacterium]